MAQNKSLVSVINLANFLNYPDISEVINNVNKINHHACPVLLFVLMIRDSKPCQLNFVGSIHFVAFMYKQATPKCN